MEPAVETRCWQMLAAGSKRNGRRTFNLMQLPCVHPFLSQTASRECASRVNSRASAGRAQVPLAPLPRQERRATRHPATALSVVDELERQHFRIFAAVA